MTRFSPMGVEPFQPAAAGGAATELRRRVRNAFLVVAAAAMVLATVCVVLEGNSSPAPRPVAGALPGVRGERARV
jgi:hypothetical protein